MNDFATNFYADIEKNIRQFGRMIIGVAGRPDPWFSYSIGNHRFGKPELLIFGLHPHLAHAIINAISETFDFATFKDGDPIRLDGPFPLMGVRCGMQAKSEYTVQASRFFGHDDYGLIQLLAPDSRGIYPHELGCQPPYRDVPVLRADA